MISLLKEIKEELVIERKRKLRNALILAMAIVMFAVPLNFMIEFVANYIDSSLTGDLDFWNYYSPAYWVFFIFIMFLVTAFWNYFRPMMRIFGASFDWETAFSVIEEENRQDEYYMDLDEEEVWYCDVCEKVFRSERHAKIGNCDCKDSKTE